LESGVPQSRARGLAEEEEKNKIHLKIDDTEKKLLEKGGPGVSPDTARGLAEEQEAYKSHLRGYPYLDYRTIIDLAKQGGSDKDVRAAMDTALSKTIDYFKRNSYYMPRNEELLAQISSDEIFHAAA